jgi:hypothetical protein
LRLTAGTPASCSALSGVALAAWRLYQRRGGQVRRSTLRPNYLRMSQAERVRMERENPEK